jgi:DUF1365 family protein
MLREVISQPYIDAQKEHKYLLPQFVTEKFVVRSTLGKKFNCAEFDSMRKKGLFLGEYSCQNQTMPVGSAMRREVGVGVHLMWVVSAVVLLLTKFM